MKRHLLRLFSYLAVLALVLGTSACRPERISNFSVEQFQGRTLSGEPVRLADLDGPLLIANVYSPTCIPCIQELPALNQLYAAAREAGVPMFLIAENDPEEFGLEDRVAADAPEEERFEAVAARLKQDVLAYGIQPPVLVMDESFVVGPDQLVTATPETLYFRQRPFAVEYNFVGPVSIREDPAELAGDTRMQFALQKLSDLLAATGAQESGTGPGY